eukprot:Seg6132.1 transcript_id=Seg6132.1/GoldUCD/mRNA.D3Y31 product="hypothetical protein" protein_id=Seg6132.1/GoldUCD/D3Y31
MASRENSPTLSTENKRGNEGDSGQEEEDYSDNRGYNESTENVEETKRKAIRPPKHGKANTPPKRVKKRKAKTPPAKKAKRRRKESSSSSASSRPSSSSSPDSESSSSEEEGALWRMTKEVDINSWKLPKPLAKAFSQDLREHYTEGDLRQNILEDCPVPKNIPGVPTGQHYGNVPHRNKERVRSYK